MLHILTNKSEQIALEHFTRIKPYIINRGLFYKLFLDVLDKKVRESELSKFNKKTQFQKQTLLNVLCKHKKKSKDDSNNFVNKRIIKSLKPFYYKNYKQMSLLINYLSWEDNIKKIITSTPENMEHIIDELKNIVNQDLTDYHALIEIIFSYDKFEDKNSNEYNSYDLTKMLNINTCPYCNRQYTFTVVGPNIIRPELDHYLPKSSFPIFSLSFYNLIPSCHICNSNLKGDKPVNITDYLHPYCGGFGKEVQFKYYDNKPDENTLNPDKYELKIEIDPNCKQEKINQYQGNIELFKILNIYEYHKDLIGEIVYNYKKNNEFHRKSLQNILAGESSKEETYRFFFNNYLLEEDCSKRVLSKFTQDIVKATPGYEELFK